jgi:hypothetical protein
MFMESDSLLLPESCLARPADTELLVGSYTMSFVPLVFRPEVPAPCSLSPLRPSQIFHPRVSHPCRLLILILDIHGFAGNSVYY